MANIFSKIMDAMKFSDDDDDEGYAEYLNDLEEKEDKKERDIVPVKRNTKNEYKAPVQEVSKKWTASDDAASKPKVSSGKGKVIQLRNNGLELNVIKPTSFGDCQDICDMLLNGDAVVINLEGFENELSQRLMDFVSGTVYAIKGQLRPVSQLIFIVSPDNVTISGDLASLVTSGGVEAPTISSDF